jgi:abhydrolase domain-containing protein 12
MLSVCFKLALGLVAVPAGLYAALLAALTTQFFQTHAVYLHAFQMTGNKDLNVPEMFGFLRGQVTPFHIFSADGSPLHAWHILPIGVYQKHQPELLEEPLGLVSDMTTSRSFRLLREDSDARLVIHFHGAGGNMGSGYRIPNYRALSAGDPEHIHVLTFDYRGFGKSPGIPSEDGVISDALAVVEWAIHVAKIPPSRILMFGQSLGTAVNMAVAEHYASFEDPVKFAGHVMIAPFVDVPTLVSTYKIAGTIPILSPLAKYPSLFDFLRSRIKEDWSTKSRIAEYVRRMEARAYDYCITLIHAEDDFDIPWHHTTTLFWHAVNAANRDGIEQDELNSWKVENGQDIGAAGKVAQWRTSNGVISEYVLKYGLHDVIMGAPIVTLTAMQIFNPENK